MSRNAMIAIAIAIAAVAVIAASAVASSASCLHAESAGTSIKNASKIARIRFVFLILKTPVD